MAINRSVLLLVGCAGVFGAVGCSRPYVITERGPQAYYQTGYPVRDTSAEIERILRSVKRIQVTGIYTTYRFHRSDRITAAQLDDPATLARAYERTTFDHSKAGTAAIVRRTATSLTLITNEHVTAMPARIVSYFEEPGGRRLPPEERLVETVSIRILQTNAVAGLPDTRPFRVTARDSARDMALLSVDVPPDAATRPLDVLNVPQGDAGRLSWGSFVYVLGYPRGYRMVTTAIVSEPRQGRDNNFMLDGLFNRGISGGVVLAVRGDTNALEWVGMARAASGDAEVVLVPEQREIEEDRVLIPYDGGLFAERIVRIDYGITFAVPMTAIRRFMQGAAGGIEP